MHNNRYLNSKQYVLNNNKILNFEQQWVNNNRRCRISLDSMLDLDVYEYLGEHMNKFIEQINGLMGTPPFLHKLRNIKDSYNGISYGTYGDRMTFPIGQSLVLVISTLDINRIHLYNIDNNKCTFDRREILNKITDLKPYWEVCRKIVGYYSNYKYNYNDNIILFRVNNDKPSDIQIKYLKCGETITFKETLTIMQEINRTRIEDELLPALQDVPFYYTENNMRANDKTKKYTDISNVLSLDDLYNRKEPEKVNISFGDSQLGPVKQTTRLDLNTIDNKDEGLRDKLFGGVG